MKNWTVNKISTYVEKQAELTFAPNQTIYSIGDPAENIFIVKRGKI